MPRPRKHGIVIDHPSPRFKTKIKLFQKRRGPTDLLWGAKFCLNGVWTPKVPLSLGTADLEEAKELSRDKLAVLEAGGELRERKHVTEHLFRHYADLAITELEKSAATASLVAAGKDITFRDLIRRIRRDLIPAFGSVAITKLDNAAVEDFVENYRVVDRVATRERYGTQKRGAARQVVKKRPAVTTLGNLDRALLHVWKQAVTAKVVRKRDRPIIDKEAVGEAGEARAFITAADCKAVYKVMAPDRWLAEENGHTTDYKRMLRAYVALIATAGFRPGIEIQRTMIGDIKFEKQNGIDVIVILVRKNAGKHNRERLTVVYETDIFPTRKWLTDLLCWHEARGAGLKTRLFDWSKLGVECSPHFGPGIKHVLTTAGVLVDPMTGEERVPYSFRHYFATSCVERRLPTAQIAQWMGTSEYMIQRHYNRWTIEANAHKVNGGRPIDHIAAELRRRSDETELMIDYDPEEFAMESL